MQANNTDFNGSLSDSDRYDITINSLVKIKEEMNKSENLTISAICNQTIAEILKDSYKRGNELRDVKKRIEQLMSLSEDKNQKHLLFCINKKIEKFYSMQNSKGLNQ